VIIGGRAHTVEEVDLIAREGFPFAEISIRDPLEFRNEINPLLRLKNGTNIFYLAHGPEEENPWDLEIIQGKFLPLIRSLLDCAAELSIALFTIHFWIDRRFVDLHIVLEKLKVLKDLSKYAADRGITLCIENLSETFSDFSLAFGNIRGLEMTLDVGHGELLAETNTAYDFTRYCPDRIHHLHLHDNRGGDTPKNDLHLPLGDGVIDFFSILRNLKANGYEKTITLEVKPQFLRSGKKMVEDIWYDALPAAKGTP